ncbi:hypothetical protein MMC29_002898 [Sticta canariensis]|nr:hypothetical protein [Sticta canariensis]
MVSSAPAEFGDFPPPPPYTPQDEASSVSTPVTLSAQASNSDAYSTRTSIRGGYIRPTPQREDSTFSSAAAYFEERPCTLQCPSFVLEHHVVFPPDATPETLGFPQPEERYRARDVQTMDWYTFVNYLLPAHNPASREKRGSSPERKDSHIAVDTSERYARIEAVVAEWNEGFFGLRGIRIYPAFVSAQAPAYRSTTSLPAPSNVPMPSQPIQTPQPYNNTSRGRHGKGHSNKYHHHRSLSVSSSSSASSSSSSSSSASSISSKDLEGVSILTIRQTINRFRLSLATTSPKELKPTFRQLRSDLRSQRRAIPRHELKADYHARKREIKAEVKSVVHEFKAARKSARKARKAEQKCRRAERRADKRGRKGRERTRRLEVDAQARAMESKARTHEFEMRAMEKALDAEARGVERDMRAREVAMEADVRAREMEARARERTLEADVRAREVEARARERALESDARAREAELEARVRGRGWGRRGGQEMGVVLNER